MFLVKLFIVLGTFFGMEAVAWLTHKYVMHGLLWHLHEDHHKKNPSSFFEKNDYFFVIFAVPGMLCILLGSLLPAVQLLLYVGLGITLYGMAYFWVHDILYTNASSYLEMPMAFISRPYAGPTRCTTSI